MLIPGIKGFIVEFKAFITQCACSTRLSAMFEYKNSRLQIRMLQFPIYYEIDKGGFAVGTPP